MKAIIMSTMVCFALSQIVDEKQAKTVRKTHQVGPDGAYSYAFETENQIFAEEQGYLKDGETQVVKGQYQFVSPEGQVIRLAYVADENGFQPQGQHLPTPPPGPPEIRRTLDHLSALSQT